MDLTTASQKTPAALVSTLDNLRDAARSYATSTSADATVRAYRSDWRHFTAWCEQHGLQHLPATAETLVLYLSDVATKFKVATIRRRLVAIGAAHRAADCASPVNAEAVNLVMRGIARELGSAQVQKAPLLPEQLHRISAKLPKTLRGLRDRAVLLLGFAGAFRRSELVALNVEDLELTPDGFIINIRRSKTDQQAKGRKIGVPRLPMSESCPVDAIRAWLDAGKISTGPLFRGIDPANRILDQALSDKTVALIVKRHVPEELAPVFSGHSLRAGFVTAAAAGGASVKSIAKTTGHKSVAVLLRYERDATLFKRNALGATGL